MEQKFINFYPTPSDLIAEMEAKVDWKKICSILEPEAGKGDIVDHITSNWFGGKDKIDCIELNEDLQRTLEGKDYRVVADDFLYFESYKQYDLIMMNPPFDTGAEHLLKAISLQKNGGTIVCILNAETLENPYSLKRKELVRKLEEYNADVEYKKHAFSSAERTTDVEIALIHIEIPHKEFESYFLESMKIAKKVKEFDQTSARMTDIAENDYIKAIVMRYQIEVETGLKLIREYKEMVPYMLGKIEKNHVDKLYNKPILELKVFGNELSENSYVESVRYKYWSALFQDERFTKAMTSDMRSNYSSTINSLKYKEFNVYNIKALQIDVCKHLVGSIEDCIMQLFDELSFTHAWYPECEKNIHYYNGWSTNKSWFVNKKVIIPCRAFSDIWKDFRYTFEVLSKFSDIEKAFDYLAGIPGGDSSLRTILQNAQDEHVTKNIGCRYFNLTFYKKGTVHIEFTDSDLLKKLNIFAGKEKNMLPPRYGKVPYEDMTETEKTVVNEFDGGKAEYTKVYGQQEKYLFAATEVLQIEEK